MRTKCILLQLKMGHKNFYFEIQGLKELYCRDRIQHPPWLQTQSRRNNAILDIIAPSRSVETIHGKQKILGRCCTSTFSSHVGVNISCDIKDLLRGRNDVSRQLSLISNALFLTFTTMCRYEKKVLNFSGMTFRH